MATPDEVRTWFETLDTTEKRTARDAEATAKEVKRLLVKGKLIEPSASDGEAIDTLKMRHD